MKGETMYFEEQTANSIYIIGLLTADGTVYKNRMTLALKDKDIVYAVRGELGVDPNRKLACSSNGMYSFSITNDTLVKELAEYNVVPNKTFNMLHPDNIQDVYYNHYLRGLIDGDGSFNIYRSLTVQLLGTENLLLGVVRNVERLTGIPGNIYKSKNERIYRAKWFKGSRDLLDYMYNNAQLKMDRKYYNYLEICNTLESSGSHSGRLTRHSLNEKDIIEKYISKINDFFGSNGRTPTYNEFRKMGSMATIYKYFGSFNKMLQYFGYPIRTRKVKI